VEQGGRPSASGDSRPPLQPVAWGQQVEPAPPIPGEALAATIAALADPATRSPRPDTCPFLRTIVGGGLAAMPIEMPDPANRCVAAGDATPQSARQQQLVCLTSGHNNCPRYLRGALVAADALAPPAASRTPSAPIIAAILILIAATAMSVGFLLVRGGFDMPSGAAGGSQLAAATVPPSQAPAATPVVAVASPSATTTAIETAAASPSPSPAPPSPAPTPTPTAAPASPAPTPAPTSNRYLLLVPCPSTPNCWVYTVRSGDNLRSIVNYFGVPYDTVLRMNPEIGDPKNIHTGDRIRMPPPTR
jgi:LysM domain